ncbi:MAG: hypothetical protein EB153_09375 [Nitrosopumilaceae archaeon]|nr:hypothetical protein [Nitrosopumilaceae archaeon]
MLANEPSTIGRNTSRLRAFPAIALYPHPVTGRWKFLSLDNPTGEPVYRDSYTKYHLIENDQINYIQMPVEEAVKKFGTQAIDAVKVQLKTILDKKTWKPRLKSELSKKQLKRLMRILVFVTEKEKGNLKARACGRGCDLDKTTYKINDISSPTANSNSLFITIDIAAREGRFIVTLDIGAAYLNANIMKETFMYVDKETAEILIEMDPSYADYREPDGRILVQLNKALYGCPESGKLWYDCVTTFLKKIGFIP